MISALSIPLEVDRGDAEIAVAELALDDHERHILTSHFDGVRVPQLMRSEPSADTRSDGGAPQVGSGGGARPLAATRPAVEDTEQRADGKPDS
jgi:hypothetical protein